MISTFLFLIILTIQVFAQQITKPAEPFAHTFSIVARDPNTGEIGVAVQSHWFSVGSIVSWAEAGVGAVATQSFVNVSFGSRGLDLLKQGKSPQDALDELLSTDEGREFRQVAIIDKDGRAAAYTGKLCIKDASHIVGKNFSVQANMMVNDKVVPAMAEAFKNRKGELAERMVAALRAAQNAGGDIRGQQSAAILVVKGESTGKEWENKLIDLRVEDNENAVAEIERLLKVFRAYEHMNAGDLAIERGDEAKALYEYQSAGEMFPEHLEIKYWFAVSLVNIGKIEDALPKFKYIFEQDKNWVELTKRIVENGLLKVDERTLDLIINIR
jgi:uncharacterized Ntn-hydrolase superfamily protein